jgi:hypothetical protein
VGTLTSTIFGGASTTFRDTEFSFEPGLSGRWIDGRGLELGAKLALSTQLHIDIDATLLVGKPVMERVGDQDLLAITSAGPVTLIDAPVLIGGVYATVGVRASVGCYARVEQHFKGTLNVDIGASVEGSALFEVSPSSASEDWISEGDVPFSADGHASVSFDPDEASATPSIYCELPRLQIFVQPGGRLLERIGGPSVYVATVGKFYASWDDGADVNVALVAGATVKPFGKQLTAEATLLTWRP